MTNRLRAAAAEGFAAPFKLAAAIVMAVLSVVSAFIGHGIAAPPGDAKTNHHQHR